MRLSEACNVCGNECHVYPRQDACIACDVRKSPTNPILPFYRNAFGSVWRDEGNDYLYWCDFKSVYRAWRPRGTNAWIANHNDRSVLCGSVKPADWDTHIDVGMVFKDAGQWYMLYRGGDNKGNSATVPSDTK